MKKRFGFTLIELLVVISIIGILVAIGVVSYASANRKSRNTKRLSDIEQLRSALEMYRSDVSSYPNVTGDVSNLAGPLTGYMAAIPSDPKGNAYQYTATDVSGGNAYGYNISVIYEGSLPTGVTNTCNPPATYTYCVKNP